MTWLASNIQSNKSQEWHKSKKGRLKSPNISKSNVNMNVQKNSSYSFWQNDMDC